MDTNCVEYQCRFWFHVGEWCLGYSISNRAWFIFFMGRLFFGRLGVSIPVMRLLVYV
jgi:hypothetical protein